MVTSGNILINLARKMIQSKQDKMSIEAQTLSDKSKMKELRVLELRNQGFSYRKIASVVHLSLRDVTKYIRRVSNKTRSPSTTNG